MRRIGDVIIPVVCEATLPSPSENKHTHAEIIRMLLSLGSSQLYVIPDYADFDTATRHAVVIVSINHRQPGATSDLSHLSTKQR